MKHGNVSIFIPHLGCPHDCVFCNQRHISGTLTPPDGDKVRSILKEALAHKDRECEIAFFGGSFTAIDREYMISLLDAANEFSKDFTGIRISTRPDCINEDVLTLLKSKGVTDVELGVQSMSDGVLRFCNRGHIAEDTVKASALIKEFGFNLGHQMMTGLPSDTEEGVIFTAKQIISLKPDTVRIYPTLVIKDTYLEKLYRDGEYTPQLLDEAVSLCARLILMFEEENIKVIRVGLHSDGIDSSFIAGPFHPAFRELCESRIYREIIEKEINNKESFNGKIYVSPSAVSKAVGQKRENIRYFSEKYNAECKVYPDSALKDRQIKTD